MSKNENAVALGKLGGKAKSDAKKEAARLNGRKGGRPKKCLKVGCEKPATTKHQDKKSTCYLDPVCGEHKYSLKNKHGQGTETSRGV